jgi:hypothetical protein
MKKATILLLVIATIFACKKNNDAPTTPTIAATPMGTLVASAKIIEGTTPGDKANGDAMVFDSNGTFTLYLTNFVSTPGPDVHVYLATNASASSFVDLGVIKSASGNQQYTIAGTPNLTNYKYLLIWCKRYSIYFGGGQFY